jgi:hypothetical protein
VIFLSSSRQLSPVCVHVCDFRRGFGLDIGFIDNFNTQLVITFNYSAIADLHTPQITIILFQPSVSSLVVA